jgi:hypothetical protein
MKLSAFDLSWYHQWPVQKTAAEEWSRPGLTNFLGSVQTGGDVTSLRHLIFPPVSGAEESTGYLTINGTFLAATQLATDIRWCPWEIRRQVVHDTWTITSRLCLPDGAHAALQIVEIKNDHDQPVDLEVAFRLSGRCVNRGLEPWYWSVPSVALSVTDLLDHAGLDPVRARVDDDTVLWQERPPAQPHPHVGQAFNAHTFAPAPHEWKRNGDPAYAFHVAPGASVSVAWAVALETTAAAAVATARTVTQNAAQRFDDARAQWQQLWQSAFSAEGPLSGRLPDLDVPPSLAPVAASGLLCALQSRRTHRANHGQPLYNISTPRRVEACFYPNDWGMASRTLAWMDPDATWRQLELALAADVRKFNQVSFFTGRGGDGKHAGWPYTVDIYNCFYAAWHLWEQAGRDPALLTTRRLRAARGEMNLLQVFEDLGFDWRSRRAAGLHLADYGPKEELLECVSTYEHVVAALNAGAAWMLQRLGEIYDALGRPADADAARAEAAAIVQDILAHLYVEGCGWFRCRLPDGRTREVRHCWDTGMVLMCIGPQLPVPVRQEIVRFFREELQTPGWIRALSPLDGDAAVSGFRADHQYNGAFGSWPAEVALGLIRIGEQQLAGEWLEGIARTARQGPFGQAHYDEGVVPSTHDGATKVTEELPQCCHWSNISGAMFFSVIEELLHSAR